MGCVGVWVVGTTGFCVEGRVVLDAVGLVAGIVTGSVVGTGRVVGRVVGLVVGRRVGCVCCSTGCEFPPPQEITISSHPDIKNKDNVNSIAAIALFIKSPLYPL